MLSSPRYDYRSRSHALEIVTSTLIVDCANWPQLHCLLNTWHVLSLLLLLLLLVYVCVYLYLVLSRPSPKIWPWFFSTACVCVPFSSPKHYTSFSFIIMCLNRHTSHQTPALRALNARDESRRSREPEGCSSHRVGDIRRLQAFIISSDRFKCTELARDIHPDSSYFGVVLFFCSWMQLICCLKIEFDRMFVLNNVIKIQESRNYPRDFFQATSISYVFVDIIPKV